MERLTPRDFSEGHLRRPGTWVVAFLADWCPFCGAFRPSFESFASEPRGASFAVGDVTDEESPLWERFGIEVIPTVIVFRDGRPVFRRDGRPGEGLGAEDLSEVRSWLVS
ncbi:MAG TPA: thioredoxin family protein [Thermoplasmata archaeon]|nr:thioredoxin family protein [Thermoplasmata archaeon]